MVSGGRRRGSRARAAGVWHPRPSGHVTSDADTLRPGRRGSARPLSQGGTVMADAQRTAEAVWEGSLAQGAGAVTLTSSGAAGPLPVTWASRTARSEGKTSPEELIAAAHATVTFAQVEGGFKVASSALTVKGTVPGLDAAGFKEAAEAAKDGCPTSGALKGNVELSVDASLA